MKKLTLTIVLAVLCTAAFAQDRTTDPNPEFKVIVDTSREAIAPGEWEPTVESLSAWECPEWFRDAKFGIWAHWGPQCEPEDGDWYARNMYIEGNGQYQYNIDTRDHPSRWGFKDWIHEWKAENWDPDALVKLYKEAGARYFFTLANHHDNFDLYDSKYQSWNSVALGPQKDIVGGWAEACKKYGLRLGVSVHAAHAWVWYETSRGADTKGPLAGVPYDGVLTKEDGVGTWWEGLDPQELYEQRHPLSKNNRTWNWNDDLVTPPDQAFCDKIYNRTVQLINDYDPDIVYFDDTYLPLWPVSDAGLKILAYGYNKSAERNGGESQIVFTGKVLTDWQKKTLLWDVERGAPDAIQELPWQTCTCIGEWHYNKHVYYEDRYKSSAQVISMLVDVVSKNGNLLLNIPLRGDGTPDPTEIGIVKQIGHWMQINSESIYDTRPWVIYGEGPTADTANPVNAQGFNEGRLKYSAKDIRFNKKGDKVLYVTLLGVPEEDITVKALGSKTAQNTRKIKSVTMLGSDAKVEWTQDKDSLAIGKPVAVPAEEAVVYKVVFK
jgi:alpha-L-fucosidase